MWSFGIILLEIVTGQLPERSQYPTPQVPEQCPASIAALIEACKSTDPAGRPTAREAIDLVMAATNEPSLSPSTQPDTQAST